jgi:hypothetical protein
MRALVAIASGMAWLGWFVTLPTFGVVNRIRLGHWNSPAHVGAYRYRRIWGCHGLPVDNYRGPGC